MIPAAHDPRGEGAPAPQGGPVARLLELQDADLHADQLRHRRAHLDERAAVAVLESELVALRGRVATTAAERDAHGRRQDELESEIRTIEARVAQIEQQSRSGAASSFRDQEAMSLEIASLARQRSALEDAELEEMEVLEPLDVVLDDLGASDSLLLERLLEARDALAVAEAAIDAELEVVASRRGELATGVEERLRREYESLRSKLGGIGVARLVRGACSGCHLALSATEADALRHAPAGTLAHCEQCGRLLVV